MPDLDAQIRAYLDATSTVLSVDDVLEVPVGRDPVRPMTRRLATRPMRRGWLVGVAAAALVLFLVGLLPVLLNRSEEVPMGTVPDSATTTASLPAATTLVESAPTTMVTIDVSASVVPGLGTLRWERLTGDETSLPRGFESDPDGGFTSHEGTRVWHSEDAVTWSSEEVAPEFAGSQWVYFREGWALAGDQDSSELYRKTGDSWVPVALESPELPETPGLEWRQVAGFPVESDGVAVINGSARAAVPWGDIYGTFEVDCGQPEPCEQAPAVRWDEPSATLRIQDPTNGSIMAVLTVTALGDTVTFTDLDTGEVVHTITATTDYPADRIAEQLTTGSGLLHAGGWVSHEGAAFVWVDFPWTEGEISGGVYAVPDGGFAKYEFVDDGQASPDTPIVSATVWTSTDGVEWTNRGEPQFADPAAQQIVVQPGLHDLRATVVTGYEDGGAGTAGMEVTANWTSTDGVTWTQLETPFPLLYSKMETEMDFGSVVTAMPQSTYLWWVSTDGATWHQVEGPQGSYQPDGADYTDAGGARNVLYVAVGEDAGTRTLWIGRFDGSP